MPPVLFAGIVCSLAVTELTGFSPGGVVAVGYLAMFFSQPRWQVGTLVAAFITFGLVRFLEGRLILYGRRLFTLYLLTGILVSQGAMVVSQGETPFGWGILAIGYLVPGLIARDFGRQGIFTTMAAIMLTLALTELLVLVGEGFL